MNLNLDYLIRLICNERTNCPIIFLENSVAPYSDGNYYWKTNFVAHGGRFRKTLYTPSSRVIKVGKNWKPKIPKNMELKTIGGTHLIRKSDKMDFHFSPKELLRKDFCGWARKEMARNYKNRLEARKLDKQFKNKTKNTFVNFLDARRAGNCCEGIINWAKKKLNMDKEALLTAPWITQVPAKLILKLDPQNNLVRNSVNQAYLRETLVCI